MPITGIDFFEIINKLIELPNYTTHITIEIPMEDAVVVECTYFTSLNIDESGDLPEVTKRFKLVEVDDANQAINPQPTNG